MVWKGRFLCQGLDLRKSLWGGLRRLGRYVSFYILRFTSPSFYFFKSVLPFSTALTKLVKGGFSHLVWEPYFKNLALMIWKEVLVCMWPD